MAAAKGDGLRSAAWGWIPGALVLAGLYCTGVFDTEDKSLWHTAWSTYAACEALRMVAVWLLPLWWRRRRGGAPERAIRESFGTQAMSLAVSTYTVAHLAQLRLYASWELPFLHTAADADCIALIHHMTVVLGTYVICDTSHLIRTWHLSSNPAMLLHHAIFSVVLGLGAANPQLPPHYRIHVVLFSAELSTPLLNLRWILRWVAHYKGRLVAPLSMAFALLFLFSRVGLYGALIADLVKKQPHRQLDVRLLRAACCLHTSFCGSSAWPVKTRRKLSFPRAQQDIFCAAVFCSYLLNLYWLIIIIKTVGGMGKKKKASSAGGNGGNATADNGAAGASKTE
ncbi:hypothetical protein JKP88DRAFT_267964 [Tribonema minus]|uniref:TLC domain-containing protein n=1 Tax=Tribonema minus TaxID=303371 RepID=A0A835ZB74_9STRA|nr:hypothetical protein JKP88DRAFT_267964 [Tribonema minus]